MTRPKEGPDVSAHPEERKHKRQRRGGRKACADWPNRQAIVVAPESAAGLGRTSFTNAETTLMEEYDAGRTDHGRGPSRPPGTADAQTGRVPALLRGRAGHDRERTAGRVRLSPRLGRLRALLAEAHRLEHVGPR